jgi:hypothetical protein
MEGDIVGAVVGVGVDEEGEWGRGVEAEEKGEGNWRRSNRDRNLWDNTVAPPAAARHLSRQLSNNSPCPNILLTVLL